MPPSVKYTDFVVSEPFVNRSKRNKDEEVMRDYVKIFCPHCKKSIVDIPVDALKTNKAGKCKAHLEVCPEFKAKGGSVTPAPTRESALSKQLAEMEARMRLEMQQNHRESMAQISRALGLGDPDATTKNEIIERNKRKREQESKTASTFHNLPMTDEAQKQYRIFLHPDKDSNHSPLVNDLRKAMMEQLLECQKRQKTSTR